MHTGTGLDVIKMNWDKVKGRCEGGGVEPAAVSSGGVKASKKGGPVKMFW